LIEYTIPLRSHDEAIQVLGPYDRNAKLMRQVLEIEIYTRGGNLRIKGNEVEAAEAKQRIEHLLGKLRKGRQLEPGEVEGILVGSSRVRETSQASAAPAVAVTSTASRSDLGSSRGGRTSSATSRRWRRAP
jgi:phosphate starvation-inducible protein PhoH